MRSVGPASLVILSLCGAADQSAPAQPAFDVVSVKAAALPAPGPGPERGMRQDAIAPSPGGVTMFNTRFKSIVQWAYHLQPIQVNGPGWIESSHYNIMAKAAGAATDDQLRRMMQNLLAQRFKLAFHKETREMPAYIVSVGKGVPKLTQSEGEGEMQVKPGANRMVGQFTHVTVAALAEMTTSPLQGVVVDETGLKGQWDFALDASSFATVQPNGIDDAINMIIQAIGEQLGLKIEQKKAPAELLIVDRAEKVPIEN